MIKKWLLLKTGVLSLLGATTFSQLTLNISKNHPKHLSQIQNISNTISPMSPGIGGGYDPISGSNIMDAFVFNSSDLSNNVTINNFRMIDNFSQSYNSKDINHLFSNNPKMSMFQDPDIIDHDNYISPWKSSLNIFYIFGETLDLSLNKNANLKMADDVKNTYQKSKKDFYWEYGSEYATSYTCGTFGVFHIIINADNALDTQKMKVIFNNKKLKLPQKNNTFSADRNINNLGNIDWNKIVNNPDERFSVDWEYSLLGGVGVSASNSYNKEPLLANHLKNIRDFELSDSLNGYGSWLSSEAMKFFKDPEKDKQVFNKDVSLRTVRMLWTLSPTLKFKTYQDEFGFEPYALYDMNYLNKFQTLYNEYLDFSKDLDYFISVKNIIDPQLKWKLFDDFGTLGFNIDNISYIFANYITDLQGGNHDQETDNVLESLQNDIKSSKITQDWKPYLKNIDFLFRFNLDIEYKQPNNTDIHYNGIMIPLDDATLNGKSNNYSFYPLGISGNTLNYDQVKFSSFKFNLNQSSNLESYNPSPNAVQNFSINTTLQDQAINFNFQQKTKNDQIIFTSLKNSTVNASLTWNGNTNIDCPNLQYSPFASDFKVKSNWQ